MKGRPVLGIGLMSKSPKDSVEELRSSSVSIPMTFDKREFFQTPSAACLKRCGILLLQVEEPFRFFSCLKSDDFRHSDDLSEIGGDCASWGTPAPGREARAGLALLYWRVGIRIRPEIPGKKRAGYGEQIVHALSAQLRSGFGEWFGTRNLFNMIRFAEVFPVYYLSPDGWSVHATAEGKTLRTRSGFILERIVNGQARYLMKIVLVPCYQRCIQ
jgi:hypothetical protein